MFRKLQKILSGGLRYSLFVQPTPVRDFFYSRKAQKAMTAGILDSQEISDFKSKMMNLNMGFTSY